MTLGISGPDLAAYANGLHAAYGTTASAYARRRAVDFGACGDQSGEAVWNQLAAMLDSRSQSQPRQ
jgi:hypothetical protein